MVVLLAGLVTLKLFRDSSTEPASSGTVAVSVWIPSDAQAQLGDHLITHPGRYDVEEGLHLMQVFFKDNRSLNCTFTAGPGVAVRFMVDAGSEGLSVNDGPVQPCTQVNSTKGEPQPEDGAPG